MSGAALTLSSTKDDAMTRVRWDLTAADLDDVKEDQNQEESTEEKQTPPADKHAGCQGRTPCLAPSVHGPLYN